MLSGKRKLNQQPDTSTHLREWLTIYNLRIPSAGRTEQGDVTCHSSRSARQPVSAQGHSTGTAGQRPSTNTAPLQTGHRGYLISLILGCTSRHSLWSPRLDMGCSVSASRSALWRATSYRCLPHHVRREHNFCCCCYLWLWPTWKLCQTSGIHPKNRK